MFQAVHCSSSAGLIVSMQHLISSLSVGDCPVHRLTGGQDSHPQRVLTLPDNVQQLHVRQPSTYAKPEAACAVLGS
jgi:hypothetical protein